MKNVLLFSLIISILSVVSPVKSQETVSMGAGYVFDVYYSLEFGVVDMMERSDWDLGFYTDPMSAAIITNGAKYGSEGVELRCYGNGDTTAWMNIDTTGLSTWTLLQNGEDGWENGAFNRHALGFPDLGWGVYNEATGNIVGDSIYIIKIDEDNYYQVWIVKKMTDENKVVIRYANIDNSNEKEETLDIDNWLGMNFVYFDFASGDLSEREPETDEWDLLFTRYQAWQPQGVYYPVTGVLNNVTTPGNMFHPVTLDFNDWFEQPWNNGNAVIGADWKYFDLGAFQWVLEDSLLFFMNSPNGNVYKIYFTLFQGTSSGNIMFEQEIVSAVDIDDPQKEDISLQISPNPASGRVSVQWNQAPGNDASIRIFDINGREILNRNLDAGMQSQGMISLDISSLPEGMYVVSFSSGVNVINKKLVVR